MKRILLLALLATTLCSHVVSKPQKDMERKEHYAFAQSEKVTRQKVEFKNRYGITLVADLYLPKQPVAGKRAAIAVSGPFGAIKEQVSGLYAQTAVW